MSTKRTKQAEKLKTARTSFELWMIRHGLRQHEAAKLLGLQLRQVQVYVNGVSPHTGKPLAPTYATRVLMRLIDEPPGTVPAPWPE